jgi:hypothetical protein
VNTNQLRPTSELLLRKMTSTVNKYGSANDEAPARDVRVILNEVSGCQSDTPALTV